MEIQAIILHEKDNVAVLASAGRPGDTVAATCGAVKLGERVPTGHKVATRSIGKGEDILKYGVVIGRANRDIDPGEWVHTHNVIDITEQLCNEYAAQYRAKVKEAEEYGPCAGL